MGKITTAIIICIILFMPLVAQSESLSESLGDFSLNTLEPLHYHDPLVPEKTEASKNDGWFSWDDNNTALHPFLLMSLYVDLKSTENFINDNNTCVWPEWAYFRCDDHKRKETNFFLGESPSIEEAREYFAWAAIGTTLITYILPPKASYVFQGSTISLEIYFAKKNIELRASYPL